MDEFLGLGRDDRGHPGMAMPQPAHRDAGQQIHVLTPVQVAQTTP